jgi:hypothetical protein
MAEERNLGVARAPEADDEDYTKAELQRRMEEARESITQTVTEIKDTVANQYQSVRDSVSEALDWREQFRKRPVAWTVGALGVGVVVGYSLGGVIVGDGEDERDYPSYDESDVYARTGATAAGAQSAFTDHRSYASHAITSGPYGSSEYAAAPTPQAAPQAAALTDSAMDSRPSYSSGYEQAPAETEEDKPGLMERFKETRAYDRLQEEVSELGNRFMDELSNAARTIVLPALFNKIKELVGVDLSNKQPQQREAASSSTRQATGTASAKPALNTQAATASASSSSTSAQPSTTPSSSGTDARSKFERLAEDSGPSTQSESSLRNASGYDDRYERESQLYAHSQNRGFGAQGGGRGESQSTSNDSASTNRDDTGHSNS